MQDYKVVLQDNSEQWHKLLPLTYTKPISALRVGINTIKEKWEFALGTKAEVDTESYLMPKFQNPQTDLPNTLLINSSIIPTASVIEKINTLSIQQVLEKDGIFIALKMGKQNLPFETVEFDDEIIQISRPWDLFKKNEAIFQLDFERITSGRTSAIIPENNQTIGEENIFIEPGATVEFSILDARTGQIYIGKDAKIMAGCMVQGGLALCNNAVLKMGTKHYGTSTIGPHSKMGGEISNIVVQGYSNKGHDGFLGNAVIGEWCNLGADTNSSNLKNNYSLVRAYSYFEDNLIETEEQFVGLMMGDHSKCAINTMFNTATVVGVAANIFGGGFPKKHIPSFTWGGVDFMRAFQINKAYDMAQAMMQRRGIEFTDIDKAIFDHIYNQTEKFRKK